MEQLFHGSSTQVFTTVAPTATSPAAEELVKRYQHPDEVA